MFILSSYLKSILIFVKVIQPFKYNRKGCMKMNLKRVIATTCAVALVSVMVTTAFAAPGGKGMMSPKFAVSEDGTTDSGMPYIGQWPELTDEQKAAMEAKRAEMEAAMAEKKAAMDAAIEAWDAMTDEQKEEVYALKDKEIDAKIALIDKYVSLGLISEDEAKTAKEMLENCKTEMRENGFLPDFGRFMGGGFGGCEPMEKGMGKRGRCLRSGSETDTTVMSGANCNTACPRLAEGI